ncbi:MAG TPA: hypothetical protein PKB15_05350 [Acidimicrobiia bacterium]|nr:hypothetical protein [Acidimicrobiia bacterium]
MIPLGKQFVSGYFLYTNIGDAYCYGDLDFYGTISDLFGETASIVASITLEHGIQMVSVDGTVYTLANNPDKHEIPNVTKVVDAIVIDDSVAVLKAQGELVDTDGKVIIKFGSDSTDAAFLSCALSSDGSSVYALDANGCVHGGQGAQHHGDLTTIGESRARARDFACSPWGNGYWIIDDIGGVFCFGDVDYFGSVPGDGQTCVAQKIIPSPTGYGYWIIDRRGMVLPFGDAAYCGHPKPEEVTGDVIGMVPVLRSDRRDHEWLFTQLVNNDIAQLMGDPLREFDEPIAQ